MGAAGRSHICQHFDERDVVRRLMAFYRERLTHRGGS